MNIHLACVQGAPATARRRVGGIDIYQRKLYPGVERRTKAVHRCHGASPHHNGPNPHCAVRWPVAGQSLAPSPPHSTPLTLSYSKATSCAKKRLRRCRASATLRHHKCPPPHWSNATPSACFPAALDCVLTCSLCARTHVRQFAFWRMVWHDSCYAIVMTTNTEEGGKIKCERYWPTEPGQTETYGDINVTLVSVHPCDGYTRSALSIERGGETRSALHFWCVAKSLARAPSTSTPILHF